MANIVTLNFSEKNFVRIPEATTTINLVEEMTFFWKGELHSIPPADIWMDTETLPALQVDATGDFEAWQRIIGNVPSTTEWGSWNTTWTDRNIDIANSSRNFSQTETIDNNGSTRTTTFRENLQTTVITDSTGQQRDGVTSTVTSLEQNNNLGTRVSDFQVEYYIRPQRILLISNSLKPNSFLKVLFDGRDVTSNCFTVNDSESFFDNIDVVPTNLLHQDIQNLWQNSRQIIPFPSRRLSPKTDARGIAVIVFDLPANTFIVGSKKIEIVEDSPRSMTGSSTTFDASGFSITKQDTILSTRVPAIERTSVQENRVLTNVISNTASIGTDVIGRVEDIIPPMQINEDPLAQTFFINTTGMLTSIDLYFYKKSENKSVLIEIRNVINGYPGPTVLPNAVISLPSSQILTSNDSSLSTNFRFPQPIPLVADTEYCIVIRPEGGDSGFELWVAELGGVDVKSGSRITRSPFSGSLFTSQNNRVWSPRQALDLTMNINMASFSLSPGKFSLINNDDEFILMKDYVGRFKVGEIVEQRLGNGVVASGIVEKIIGNKIWLNNSNGLFIKSDTIDVIGKESSAAMRIEDFFITIVDVIHPQISYLEFDSTVVGFELTYYTTQSTKKTMKIEPNVDTTLLNPAVLRSKSVEVSQFSGYKSLKLSIDMSTQTDNISPMFDLSKCGLILISNRIGNTPLEFEIFDGDALSKNSKYITKLVTLAEGMDAEDLQVYLTANIPGNTFVDVFYKIINIDDVRDVTENYSLHEWNKMVPTSIPGNNSSGFIEYKYVPEESAYTTDGYIKYTYDGDTFVTYKFYMIKLVMRSDNSSLLPMIKNFRSIALQK